MANSSCRGRRGRLVTIALTFAIATTTWIGIAGPAPTAAAPARVYISPNGSDANTGLSESAPWRTVGRVQRALDADQLVPGTQVLFRRGATFRGSLSLDSANSGTPDAPITFSSYGTGTAPVLSAAVQLGGWTQSGTNRWSTTCAQCPSTPSQLTVDGAPMSLARWPNATDGDGYRYFTGAVGDNVIVDSVLPSVSSTNWVGGELVLRSIAWVLDRLPITAYNAGRFTLGKSASYPPEVGYGYFLQNHPAALDRQGEWVWNPTTKTITMFSTTSPASSVVEVAASDAVFDIDGAGDIIIEKMTVTGGRLGNVRAGACTRVYVREITSTATSGTGIQVSYCASSAISSSQIVNAADKGVQAFECKDCLIFGNTIRDTAVVAGMGLSGDGHYLGAELKGPNLLFIGNQVIGVGYIGIDLRGGVIAARNIVRDFNRVKIDGGGIYSYDATELFIANNYVADSRGSTAGTPWSGVGTQGIYIDDDSQGVWVTGNTISNVGASGVYLHNTRSVIVAGNTVVGAREHSLEIVDDDLGVNSNTNLAVVDNTFVTTHPSALAASIRTTSTPPNTRFLDELGVIDRNRYCDVYDDATFEVEIPALRTIGSLADWQALSGVESNSTRCSIGRAPFQVTGTPGPELVPNGQFPSGLGAWFGWPDEALVASWDPRGINGGALRFSNNGNNDVAHIDAPVGAVASATTYRLRFTARADRESATLTTFLRQLGEPYAELARRERIPLGTQSKTYEIFFTTTRSATDSIAAFELDAPGVQVWLDDVSLRSVQGAPANPSDFVQVEANTTTSTRTVVVTRQSVDAAGKSYSAGQRLTLEPFRSIVLIAK